ncbi:hypothetical protein ACP70R_010417 [Stipagrostis hirtigluma subsp. patula]
MAALRPCASTLIVGARRPSTPSPLRTISPLGRRGSYLILNLKTSARRTAAPCVRHRHGIHAQNGDRDYWPAVPDPDDDKPVTKEEFNKFLQELMKYCELLEEKKKRGSVDNASTGYKPLADRVLDVSPTDTTTCCPIEDMPFREDMEKIDEYGKKMTSWNTSIFHLEARALSLHLCMVVKTGVEFASHIMDCATVAMYVASFVNLAEVTYHKKFNDESLLSLLGAFWGLAAISHILVEDALNYVEDSPSKYNLVHDIENSRREYEQKMKNLEHNFTAVVKKSNSRTYQFLKPTMADAMNLTMLFVFNMITWREMILGYVPGDRPRRRI